MEGAQDRRKQLTVLYEESHAAAARWDVANVRSQEAPQLLGLKEASIATQVFGELSCMKCLIDSIKLT